MCFGIVRVDDFISGVGLLPGCVAEDDEHGSAISSVAWVCSLAVLPRMATNVLQRLDVLITNVRCLFGWPGLGQVPA
jgi:hypothetical protein